MKRLALHTCCAPCLIEPLRLLSDELDDNEITAVYYNPNIESVEEYERRRDTFMGYACSVDVAAMELPYDNGAWREVMCSASERAETPERCENCYRVRFERVAKWAVEQGFTHFATTLTVSPYQQRDVIDRVACEVCAEHGLEYIGRDFSEHFGDAQRIARDLGLYRQSYCGCAISKQLRET